MIHGRIGGFFHRIGGLRDMRRGSGTRARLGLAGVDLRKDQLIVYSSSRTKDGLWVANGAFVFLERGCPDSALGTAALRMLDASLIDVQSSNLRASPSPFAPVIDALGLKTWSGYARGVRHVGIEREGAWVDVAPSRNGGSREGFVGMAELTVSLQEPSAGSLGRAVMACLALAS